jgi:hypothetical protein
MKREGPDHGAGALGVDYQHDSRADYILDGPLEIAFARATEAVNSSSFQELRNGQLDAYIDSATHRTLSFEGEDYG